MKLEAGSTNELGRHTTVVHERLTSQVGVYFVNKLPNCIKSAAMSIAFKTGLKIALASEEIYSTSDFRAHNLDP